jgi:N-acetylneuraminate synthase
MALSAKRVIPGNSKKSIYEIIDNCSLSEEDEFKLMKFVKSKNKIFISTPFSRAAADRLEKFKIPAYKIGSGECNNYPLVEYIAKKGKPIILSTGMNNLISIDKAVKILKKYNTNFALMHCTNLYPTPNHLTRLECVQLLKKKYPTAIIGYSDHTSDNNASLGAVALGAQIIERHFTYSKKVLGPDISCSMDNEELKNLKI